MKKPPPDRSFTIGTDPREILDDIRLLVQHIRLASRDSEKQIGLSAAQLFVLHKIGDEEGLSVNDLADRTMTHQSSVSSVVQKLESKGLVRRSVSENDGRKSMFFLTKKGSALMEKAPQPVQDTLIEALEKMDPKALREFAEGFSAFLRLANIKGRPPLLFAEDTLAPKTRKKIT
jgi:DNA-binding MarR family transcriptional regulator